MASLPEISRRIASISIAVAVGTGTLGTQPAEAYLAPIPHGPDRSALMVDPSNDTPQAIKYSELISFLLDKNKNLNDLSKKLTIILNNNVQLFKVPNSQPGSLGNSADKVSMYMFINLSQGSMVFVFAPENGTDLSTKFKEGTAIDFERVEVPNEIGKRLAQNSVFPLVFEGQSNAPILTPVPTPKPLPCNIFELPCYEQPVEYASLH